MITRVGCVLLSGLALGLGARQLSPHLLLAAAVYLGSHALRIARLVVLAGDTAPHLRDLAWAHALSAPGAILPFKSGELLRWGVLSRALGPAAGLRAVWMERTFDAAALLAVGLASTWILGHVSPVPVLAMSAVFLLLTAVAIVALPENVANAKNWLIRRYTARWAVGVLRGLDRVGPELEAARGLVRGKLATLGLLTVGVWTTEGVALWLISGGRGWIGGELLTLLGASAVQPGALPPALVLLGTGALGFMAFGLDPWNRKDSA